MVAPLLGPLLPAEAVRHDRHRLQRAVHRRGRERRGAAGHRRHVGWGRTPGILLRGYGTDEPLVHRRLVPEGVVVADPDRVAGAAQARAAGADILVLDDAFQLLSVVRDLNIAVVSAESVEGS